MYLATWGDQAHLISKLLHFILSLCTLNANCQQYAGRETERNSYAAYGIICANVSVKFVLASFVETRMCGSKDQCSYCTHVFPPARPLRLLKMSRGSKPNNEGQHDAKMQKHSHNSTTNHPEHDEHAQSGIREGGPAE